jgi:hypothetical protein
MTRQVVLTVATAMPSSCDSWTSVWKFMAATIKRCWLRLNRIRGSRNSCRHCLNLTYQSVQEHDKRVDYLVKHFYLIPAMVESNDARKSPLALKACGKIYG